MVAYFEQIIRLEGKDHYEYITKNGPILAPLFFGETCDFIPVGDGKHTVYNSCPSGLDGYVWKKGD